MKSKKVSKTKHRAIIKEILGYMEDQLHHWIDNDPKFHDADIFGSVEASMQFAFKEFAGARGCSVVIKK